MKNPFRREKLESKEVQPASVNVATIMGMTPDLHGGLFTSYDSQLQQGLAENPYIFKAVDLRAHAVSTLDPILKDQKGEVIENANHPLMRLLKAPNPDQSWAEFVYDLQAHYALNGNAFIWMRKEAGSIKELRAVPPSKVGYLASNELFHPVKVWTILTGQGMEHVAPQEMIHIHTLVGTDGILGVSPLQAAGLSIRAQTSARAWNTNLLDNAACPGMALTTEKALSAQQTDALYRQFHSHEGASNAGKTLVLDNGLHPEPFGSFSAHDMSYCDGIILTAREVALAMSVPPEVLGDSTNKTFNSMAESMRQFANTVATLADKMYSAISRNIAGYYPDVAEISYDKQQIEGLTDKPSMADISSADWLTINEKRELLSYPPVDGGDTVLTAMGQVPLKEVSSDIDDLVGEDE